MCLRYADLLYLWLWRPQFVGPGGSWAFCLSFVLQLALFLKVPVGSLLPYGSHPSRWGVEALFVLDRNEGSVCFLFPFGLFLRVVPALRDEVTIWVRCVGLVRPTVVVGAAPFLLMDGLRTSV